MYVKNRFSCGNERKRNVFRVGKGSPFLRGEYLYALYRGAAEYPQKEDRRVKYRGRLGTYEGDRLVRVCGACAVYY